MKKLLLIVIVALIGTTLGHAQGVFFSSKEGTTLEYAEKNAKGKVTGYVSYTVRTVDRQDENNFTVEYTVAMVDDKRKEVMQPMDVAIKVVNGTVFFDGNSVLGKLAKDLQIKGSGIVIPSNISVGQKLDDYSVTVEAIATSSSCTNVVVAAEEKVTTDGGTFDTYRIDMDIASKALIINFKGTSSQWYAKGIGEVKSVSYDKNGKVSGSRELVKITQ